jgi:murein DD-endopeptidase MepM/ murein hydrolase activator NlpD
LSHIDVSLGQSVERGEFIARVGSTGRSTGPHLHYEVRINDEPVNPLQYLLTSAVK